MGYDHYTSTMYGILMISFSLLADCQVTNSQIGANSHLRSNDNSSVTKSFEKSDENLIHSTSTHKLIGTSSERNQIVKPATDSGSENPPRNTLSDSQTTDSLKGPGSRPIVPDDTDSRMESSRKKYSTAELEITTVIGDGDILVKLLKNSTENYAVLSCTCVQCNPATSIELEKLQSFIERTPNIRVEMENCNSTFNFLEVCCLKPSLGHKFENLGTSHFAVSKDYSTTESLTGSNLKNNSKKISRKPSNLLEGISSGSTASDDDINSTSESTTTADSKSTETTTSFEDFLKEFLKNSDLQDVVLSCECVPYYRCDPANIIVPQLQNDKAFPKVRVEMENCSVAEVCCLKNATIPVPDFKERANAADRCGIRNSGGIGNQSTQVDLYSDYGEFPWVVAILVKSDNYYKYSCAGSVIDRNVILTSAHCVAGRKPSDIKVRAGEWDTRNTEEFFPHQDLLLHKIIIHKDYNPRNVHNDIAILILKESLMYHIHIGRICLSQATATDQFPVNASCFSTGWGKDSYDSESLLKVIPKKVPLELVDHDQCEELLRTSRLGQYFKLHESFICAHDRYTCSGDGGSPLMCSFDSEPGVYKLLGMVAWGVGCGSTIYPSVFVNVAMFRTWISDQLELAGIKTNSL